MSTSTGRCEYALVRGSSVAHPGYYGNGFYSWPCALLLIKSQADDGRVSAVLVNIVSEGGGPDNWYMTLQEAKQAALEEFGTRLEDWVDVPATILDSSDIYEYVKRIVRDNSDKIR